MTIAVPASLVDIDSTFLPISQMRQISRVTEIAGPAIIGEVDLGPGHWVYAQHFPRDPIFPGTLIMEAAGQLVALWAWADGLRGRPRLVRIQAEFSLPVRPSDACLTLRGQVRRKRNLCFGKLSVQTTAGEVANVSATLAVLALA